MKNFKQNEDLNHINLIKQEEEKFYAEKVIQLSNIWNAHSGFDLNRKYNKLPFEKEKTFTFGSLNNFRKISSETVDAWSLILQTV